MKNIVRTILWIVFFAYISLFVLPKIPAVQTLLADTVGSSLGVRLGTKVKVGRIDLRLFNRIIIDDLSIYDKQNKLMLSAGRVSATIEIIPLLDKKIAVSSAQLFGMKAVIYKKDSISQFNCQFVLDSLQSKDTEPSAPLDLRIASLIIRNGNITYDQWDKPYVKGRFSPYHIEISKLSSHIVLRRLTDDSIDLLLKRMSFNEGSGLRIKTFTAGLKATNGNIKINNFHLSMPKSSLEMPFLNVAYSMDGNAIRKGSLQFSGEIKAEKISVTDIKPLLTTANTTEFPTLAFTATAKGTDKSASTTFSAHSLYNNNLELKVSATIKNILTTPQADILLSKLSLSEEAANTLSSIIGLPEKSRQTGSIYAKGHFNVADKRNFAMNANIRVSKVGDISIRGRCHAGDIDAVVDAPTLDMARITNDESFGKIKCNLNIKAHTDNNWNITSGKANGTVSEFVYNNYNYRNIKMNMAYEGSGVSGFFDIQDDNIKLTIDGKGEFGRHKSLQAAIKLSDFCPSALNLTKDFKGDRFSFYAKADAKGTRIDDIAGSISLENISIKNPDRAEDDIFVNNITMSSEYIDNGKKLISVNSDFADIDMLGNFSLSSIPYSFIELISSRLPATYLKPKSKHNSNDFSFDATVRNIRFLKRLFNIPIDINGSVTASGYVKEPENEADFSLYAPSLHFSGIDIANTDLRIWTEDDAIRGTASTLLNEDNGQVSINMDCRGENNDLHTLLSWDNMRENTFRGQLNTITHFSPYTDGSQYIQVSIPYSSFEVGDTLWNIHSLGINYSKGRLEINNLAIENENQHLYVNGTASDNATDTIFARLKDINISYILDLVNFHSVEFDGRASGKVTAFGVMKNPMADADLSIKDFRFEGGRLGLMHITADYDNEQGQININGNAARNEASTLNVTGNISPVRNTIDLSMVLQNTSLEFMQSFCGSFMHDIDLWGTGRLRLHGPLKAINLEGQTEANGAFTLTSTNCKYIMEHDTITFVPNDIQFNGSPLKDEFGNVAYLTGGVHHKNLSSISYDITARTDKFLVYNFPTLRGDETFCGYAIIDGRIGIHGIGNEVNITADCNVLDDSYCTYNASSPETIREHDFITWGKLSVAKTKDATFHQHDNANICPEISGDETPTILDSGNDRANIRLNFMLNVTPKARVNIIMDETTGDYVDLYGTGALNIRFYNKGTLDIFGNFAINQGLYKMTIQNLIRRDFSFQKGGNIVFAGNPYNAILNLKAAYMLNSVSLADLNIGSSFKSNNVPVTCLMNITGTPESPKVEFDLSLPSLSSDARQMVYSVINSAEEMNQQALYLLTIGRFYAQSDDNENLQRTNRSTLAMQSFLSGTLSQQLNNLLGDMIGNNNWSIGANITPGADGFNNGVYEGLLSGRMLNNRLLFNGQFGYRDNINTDTQNFIGEFTLQYLLTPNGNFSLKMYNQANDRYFTRSSLNTQGIGVVIQKQFGR